MPKWKQCIKEKKGKFASNANVNAKAGNTKKGSITVLLTSCLTGLESAVGLMTIFVFICKTD